MHRQLVSLTAEFEAARERLHALADSIDDSDWNRRAEPARWSVAECVAHLNLTAEFYLPLIDEALGRAYAKGNGVSRRLRRTLVGWFLWRTMGPPVRMRTPTIAPFVPTGDLTKTPAVREFDRLHQEQLRRIRAADGYPIDRVRLTSPFNSRVRYDLYSCFGILARHEHRHLWQAEQVRRARQAREVARV